MMQRALDLAAQGIGLVSPGPLVGCVIADERQQIVGEGFYVYEDLKHAEVSPSNRRATARGARLLMFL